MPVTGMKASSQATISSFFKSSPHNPKRPASPVLIDLTADSNDESPTKKARKSGPTISSHMSSLPISSSGVVEQWSFVPTSLDKAGSCPIRQRTEAELFAQEARREAFKKKLLLENNPFLRKEESHIVPMEVDEPGSSGEESDYAFKELNAMFSNTAKGKGKSKPSLPARQSKKPLATGPSGQPYTPLENQVHRSARVPVINLTRLCLDLTTKEGKPWNPVNG